MTHYKCKLLLSVLTMLSIPIAWGDEVFTFTTHDYAYYVGDNANPDLTLKRGATYQFKINTPGHPLWIKTEASPGMDNALNKGITANGIDKGTITFTVPNDAPDQLIYNCQYHIVMRGVIHITN